jgi:hypothetical protein
MAGRGIGCIVLDFFFWLSLVSGSISFVRAEEGGMRERESEREDT